MASNSFSVSKTTRVVIIGNGIAGITAARHIRKLSDHSITVISSESLYFYSRTALMYVYMGHMRQKDIEPYEPWFWEKNRINLIQDHVERIDFDAKKLFTRSGQEVYYDKLILACGSVSNSMDIPGIDASGVTGLYSLQDLSLIESMSSGVRNAIIIGGGLIGIELAEMLSSRKIPVTYLVRESGFWNSILPAEEAEMINQHIIDHDIDLRLNTDVVEIKKNTQGHVIAVQTKEGDEIPCDIVGLTVGVRPNIDWLKNSPLELKSGILVDEYLRTSIPDVFAIGDCVELRNPPAGRSSIEAIWYSGRMMGETVAYTVCGHETKYLPGIWYNSAKFFDIEYQVYGDISVNLPADQKTFFWQHPEKKKSIRINYRIEGEVVGFKLMGIRFRQEVCEKWIEHKYSIDNVLEALELAVFDAEFSDDYYSMVRAQYHKSSGRITQPRLKRNYNPVFKFLSRAKI